MPCHSGKLAEKKIYKGSGGETVSRSLWFSKWKLKFNVVKVVINHFFTSKHLKFK